MLLLLDSLGGAVLASEPLPFLNEPLDEQAATAALAARGIAPLWHVGTLLNALHVFETFANKPVGVRRTLVTTPSGTVLLDTTSMDQATGDIDVPSAFSAVPNTLTGIFTVDPTRTCSSPIEFETVLRSGSGANVLSLEARAERRTTIALGLDARRRSSALVFGLTEFRTDPARTFWAVFSVVEPPPP
jgi:hypothetical protein